MHVLGERHGLGQHIKFEYVLQYHKNPLGYYLTTLKVKIRVNSGFSDFRKNYEFSGKNSGKSVLPILFPPDFF